MYKSQLKQQQEQRQQKIQRPFSSTLMRLAFLMQRPQTKKYYQQQKQLCSDRYKKRHRQKRERRLDFSHYGLGFLILLSVIRDSLTTTYSTSYSFSLDVTTMAPQTNFLPYFDFDVPRNVTVTVGQTGFLHCRVERLGDKDVSWIRKRDLHILTAGSTTYTSDQRFQVLRPENSGNWTLQIKYPQPRDSGIYECQINTEPKMSLSYTFNVVELKATIVGPSDLYVRSGSDINLTCRIIQGPHELGNIFWYKGSEIIDTASNQNEIDSGTRITVANDWSDGLTSRLKIRSASSSDTGNYTCVPTIAKSSSVYAHVIIGEHPAAMQHNSSNPRSCNFYTSLCCMLFTILSCCLQYLANTNSNNRKNFTRLKTTALGAEESSTSIASLSMANATLRCASLSASTSETDRTIKKVPAVKANAHLEHRIWTVPSNIKTNLAVSPGLTTAAATSASSASTAATTCRCKPRFVCNDEISS